MMNDDLQLLNYENVQYTSVYYEVGIFIFHFNNVEWIRFNISTDLQLKVIIWRQLSDIM